MSRNTATFALAALVSVSVGAAAKGPQLPVPDPERGALAVTIKAIPPMKLGSMPAVQIFLVNLDRDADPLDAESVTPSNYSDGEQVYFLNARPGRYVAVAARLRGAALSREEFHAFFSQEMIPQTETTVVAGRMAFMGRFTVQTSTKMTDADPAQAHYYRLILPETSRLGFMARALNGTAPYTAQLAQAARDTQTAEAFWAEADRRSFKGEPSWQELVRAEAGALKK
jgi:hypothetical protein